MFAGRLSGWNGRKGRSAHKNSRRHNLDDKKEAMKAAEKTERNEDENLRIEN